MEQNNCDTASPGHCCVEVFVDDEKVFRLDSDGNVFLKQDQKLIGVAQAGLNDALSWIQPYIQSQQATPDHKQPG